MCHTQNPLYFVMEGVCAETYICGGSSNNYNSPSQTSDTAREGLFSPGLQTLLVPACKLGCLI